MNKVCFSYVLLIMCFLQSICSQIDEQEDYYDRMESLSGSSLLNYQLVGNPTVQSPDVAAFQKVHQVPVNNYTGRANVTVPIYQINVGQMSIPISLSYNTSGVKVCDMPSNVGSNWALNAGGVVTRSIKGIDDNVPEAVDRNGDVKNLAGWISLLGADEPNVSWSSDKQHDPAPDVYHVNAPGLSTKYIHKKVTRGGSSIPEAIELEHQGNIIEEDFGRTFKKITQLNTNAPFEDIHKGMHYIDITSINGVTYSFEPPEVSFTYLTSYRRIDTKLKCDAYKLDHMFDPSTNQSIDFEYETYKNSFGDRHHTGSNSRGKKMFSKTSQLITNRLSKITFDGGEVEFVYGLQRLDNTGEKALTAVRVTNHLGDLIKHMKFEYSYFQSRKNPTTPQSKRLRLDKVYEVDANGRSNVGEHIFTYNTSVDMPPRNSSVHDFLGYNNASTTVNDIHPVAKLYFNWSAYQNNLASDNDEMRTVGSPFAGDLLNENATHSLRPNEEASKAYILEKIQYPTGGYSEFEYESHRFPSKGGGLRIKSQKLIDEYGKEQVLDYTYFGGKINSMPVFASFGLKYNRNFTNYQIESKSYNVTQAQVELTNGSFVGYSGVTVKNRYNNGQTIYRYSNTASHPNIPSKKTIFGDYFDRSKQWEALGHYSLSVDRDFMRGKLLNKEVYDANDKLVLKEEYEYKSTVFQTIRLSFMNRTNLIGNYPCVDRGVYRRNCGGYDEVLELPIERNLVKSIKTNQLPDINDYKDKQVQRDEIEEPKYITYKSIKTYNYSYQSHLVASETEGVYPCEQEDDMVLCDETVPRYIKRRYSYPSTNSLLGSQHRLSTPINLTVLNQDGILKTEEHDYKDFGNNIIGLESVNYYSRGEEIFGDISAEITKRDAKGNITEVRSKDGIYSSFIYGYGSRYMICKLENIQYSDMISALSNTAGLSVSEISDSNNDNEIKSVTNQLRNYLTDGRISSYTYKPLVGVTSMIDIRGRQIIYDYDANNRLKLVKDHDQNIVSKNTYNYKN